MNTEATQTINSPSHAEAIKELDEKVERGKRLITHIAMSSSDDYTVIDSLMEVLELFMPVSDIAEDLQNYLFTWTREHGDALSNWKEEVLSGKKYPNEFGVTVVTNDNDGETEIADGEKYTDDAETDNLALMLSGVLTNPNLPANVYNALSRATDDVFNELPGEANAEISAHQNSPEYLAKLIKLSKEAE